MDKVFSEILRMSIDSAWLIIGVVIVRAVLNKAPKYFRKILWALVGLRLSIPFSLESMFSLVPAQTQQVTENVVTQVVNAPVEKSITILDVVPFLWVIVAIVFLLYGISSYIRLRLKIIDGILLEDNIYHSDKIESPFVCGFIKPKIYLPNGLDDATQKCVLQHEKTHIKYADHIVKAISFVVLCVHWFNPLVWISYFMLCKDIELSCDESVIKKYDAIECRQYAKALLELGVNKVKFTACPVAFGEVSIKKRIKSVINYKKTGRFLIVLSLGLCTVVALCFMTEPEVKAKEVQQEKTNIEETTEPATEKETTTEPTTEPATEPTTADEIEPITAPTTEVVTEVDKTVEETTEDYEELYENMEIQREKLLENMRISDEQLIEEANKNNQNNFVFYHGENMSANLVPTGGSNSVQYPAVSFPADPTPTHNYGNTNYPHFEGNQWGY